MIPITGILNQILEGRLAIIPRPRNLARMACSYDVNFFIQAIAQVRSLVYLPRKLKKSQFYPISPNSRPDLQIPFWDNQIIHDAHYSHLKRRKKEVKKQFCSIRLPEEIFREIEKIAKKEDRTRSAVIRRIVQQFFSKEETNASENHPKNNCHGNDIDNGGGL